MNAPTRLLGEVVRFVGGGTPKRSNPAYWGGSIPWATVKDFNTGGNLETPAESITEVGLQNSASNLIDAGTVVIPTRMALGKAAITVAATAINQDLKAVIPTTENLDTRYLLWYFLANGQRIEAMGKGATVKGVTLEQLRQLKIPLPPLPEQRRIAAILDQADALRAKRRQAIAKLDALLQSVFLEMFGDPVTNPKGWPIASLGDLGRWQSGGTPSRSKQEYFEGDVPWFSSGELNDVYVYDSVERITREAIEDSASKLMPSGTLMIGMYDTAAFKSSITTRPSCCNQAIAFARLDDKIVDVLYLYQALQIGKEYFKRQQRGVRQKNLNLTIVRSTSLPLPPVALQKGFSKVMKTMLSESEIHHAQLTTMDHLRSSIQVHCFS